MADDLQRPTPDLYETDYVAWAEAQAAALRARGAGRNALDYDNLAEEVADLGKSEIHACESQIANIIEHLLKIEFVGPIQALPHWRKEVRGFRRQLNRHLTRTIENRLRPRLAQAFSDVVGDLVTGETLSSAEVVADALAEGYTWDQVIGPDWYPEPRYGD
jgi:hypothetical protein